MSAAPILGVMLWWSWVLLWTVLVLAGAVVLGLLLWRVVRRGLAVLHEAESAAEDLGGRWDAAAVARPVRPRPEPAVLTPVGQALADYRLGRDRRSTARLQRRIERKDRAGRPQRISDLRRAERKGILHG